MYEKTIPATTAEQEKRARTLSLRHRLFAALAFAFAILALLLLIGVVVIVFLLEFTSVSDVLLATIALSFAAGALLCAPAAYLLSRFAMKQEKRCEDFAERCDSPESFFVGEGTLATFGEGGLLLHAADKEKQTFVPYAEMRFFSVCTRRAPAEKGTWSVVFEIPAHYLRKDGKAKGEPPALIQTDSKPRLLATLERYGLELLGEQPEEPGKNVHFTPLKKFALPNAKKRRTALIILGMGAVFAVAGVPVAIFFNVTAGGLIIAVGLFIAIRQTVAYMRARALFAVYKEGIYWRESDGPDRMFLKWEEISRLVPEEVERDGERYPVLTARCLYGDYRFPRPRGAIEYLAEVFPEKIENAGSFRNR